MFLTELFEDRKNVLVVYPGRFQPFHKGHRAVYDYLVKNYGSDNVFIATSDKVDPPKSPFNFRDKLEFIALTGVPTNRVVQSVQPYKAEEITRNYDPTTTSLIFAVSEKDMAEDPRFKSWTKKDGSPTYFQPMPKAGNLKSFDQHGYILTVPTFEFKVLGEPMRSATEVRAQFASADAARQKDIVLDLFGAYNDRVLQIMQAKIK